MNKAILISSFLALAFLACKQDPSANSNQASAENPRANPTNLAGHWIAIDFCSFANQYGSVLQAMNNAHVPYAYAITFNPATPDSALCFNAFESWKVRIEYKADTLKLLNARPGKTVYLIYNSSADKDITMIDPTGPRTYIDRFIKSKAGTVDGYTAFTTALNHNLLNGVFLPVGKPAAEKIMFTPGGFLQGMKEFDRYELCTGGDCFVAGQDIDVLTFYHSRDKASTSKIFGYRYNGQNDTLTIYKLLDPKPNEKGTQQVGPVAYRFSRKKAM